MTFRAEWEEFGKAGLGRKAGKHGTGTKGKNRHKRNGGTGHSRTGQDGRSGNAWESMVGLEGEGRLGIPVHSKAGTGQSQDQSRKLKSRHGARNRF
jgi:hypothetical protein